LPVNRNAYEKSRLNIEELRRFAKRVARETTVPLYIDTRHHTKVEKTNVKKHFWNADHSFYTVNDYPQQVQTDFWVLERRFYRREEIVSKGTSSSPYHAIHERENILYCLDSRGELVRIIQSWKEYERPRGFEHCDFRETRYPFVKDDFLLFDFEGKYTFWRSGKLSGDHDRSPNFERLLVGVKGDGLHRLLKKLHGSPPPGQQRKSVPSASTAKTATPSLAKKVQPVAKNNLANSAVKKARNVVGTASKSQISPKKPIDKTSALRAPSSTAKSPAPTKSSKTIGLPPASNIESTPAPRTSRPSKGLGQPTSSKKTSEDLIKVDSLKGLVDIGLIIQAVDTMSAIHATYFLVEKPSIDDAFRRMAKDLRNQCQKMVEEAQKVGYISAVETFFLLDTAKKVVDARTIPDAKRCLLELSRHFEKIITILSNRSSRRR